mgnify:FL=1
MKKKEIPVWILSFLFFGILCAGFGVGLYPDSESYLYMTAEREPLYPLFLHLCERMFKSHQLQGVIVIQNILAACSVAYFTCTMHQLFLREKKPFGEWGGTLILWGCALMPHLMTPLGSASHMVLSNSILTEGLTYSFYLLFTTELLRGLLEKGKSIHDRRNAYLRALVFVFFLLLLRNQMVTTLLIWIIVAGFSVLDQKAEGKKKVFRWGGILLTAMAVFLLKSVCFQLYYDTYCEGHSGKDLGNVGFLANALYLADGTENVIIQDSVLQSAYEQMRIEQRKQGLFVQRAGTPIGRALHYEDCYDPLKFDVIQPILEKEVKARGITGRDVNATVYGQCGEMFRELLPTVRGSYLSLIGDNLCLGLIRTVSLPSGVFLVMGIAVYLALMVLLVWNIREKKSREIRLLLFLALGMTLLHTGATAAVIMCLSRYVIYNTTLLYSAGFLALQTQYQKN